MLVGTAPDGQRGTQPCICRLYRDGGDRTCWPTCWSVTPTRGRPCGSASGLCVAGCYTVIEAWLQAKVTNETRGRAMGTYRIVDMSGSLVAQLMIGVLTPASYVSYNLLAILCCAALLPITLTTTKQPETPEAPRLRPRLAFERSPLAAAGVVVAALSSASFRMVGPVLRTGSGAERGANRLFSGRLRSGRGAGPIPCRMAGGQIRPPLGADLAVRRGHCQLRDQRLRHRIGDDRDHGHRVLLWADILSDLFGRGGPRP